MFNLSRYIAVAMLFALVEMPSTVAAEILSPFTPRLELWITEPIGATNASQCNLQASPATLPLTQPTLTEQDIIAWDSSKAFWTLNPVRFSRSNAMQQLQDHCFVLTIDGKLLSSGVVLAAYSARLIRFPTISVHHRNKFLDLQLTGGFYGSHSQPILVNELNAVLAKSVKPGKK